MAALILIIMIVMIAMAAWKPPVAIAISTCLFVFEQWAQANSSFFVVHPQVLNYLFGIAIVSAVIGRLVRDGFQIGPYPWGWAFVVMLFVYAALSIFWSIYPEVSIIVMRHHLPYILTVIGLAPLVVRTSDDYRLAFRVTAVMSAVVALLLVLGTHVGDRARTIEAAGMIVDRAGKEHVGGNPLAAAQFGGLLVIYSVFLTLPRYRKTWSWLRFLLIACGLFLVLRSESRGQFIALVVTLIAFVPIRWPRINLTNFLTVAVVSLVFYAVSSWAFANFVRVGDRWSGEGMAKSYSHRTTMSADLLSAWVNSDPVNLIFGLGSSASFHPDVAGFYVHVLPVEIVGELGLVGVSIFVLILALVARSCVRLWWATRGNTDDRAVFTVMVAFFVYMLILSCKQGALLGHIELFMMLILLFRFDVVYAKEQQMSAAVEQLRTLWRRKMMARRLALLRSPQGASVAMSVESGSRIAGR